MTAGRKPVGLLLAPGASAGRTQATLVVIDRAMTAEGFTVARMDFPYRRAGRRAPDKPEVLIGAVVAEAAALPDSLFLGGRSMGGRICSLAVAAGLPACGLVLISYPLHPPGRPDKLRVEHFPNLTVPCLFVSGTRDAFGSPEEFQAQTTAIPGPVTFHWIEGKDHGLRGVDAEVTAAVRDWLNRRRPRG